MTRTPRTAPAIRWERSRADAPTQWGRGRRTGRAWLLTRSENDPRTNRPLVTVHVARTPEEPAEPGGAFPVGRAETTAAAKRKAAVVEALAAYHAERQIEQGRWPDRRGEPAGPDARPPSARSAEPLTTRSRPDADHGADR